MGVPCLAPDASGVIVESDHFLSPVTWLHTWDGIHSLASDFLTLLVAFATPFCTSVSHESGVGGNYLSGVEEHVSSTET